MKSAALVLELQDRLRIPDGKQNSWRLLCDATLSDPMLGCPWLELNKDNNLILRHYNATKPLHTSRKLPLL